MSNMVAERVEVSKTGASFVPTKEDLKKVSYLRPNADRLIFIKSQKAPRKPPSRIQFGMVRDRRLKIVAPIPLTLERKKNSVVAKWEAVGEFGYGENVSQALDDFGRTIEELFLSLTERKDSLGSDLLAVFNTLSKHIQFRQQRG